MPRPRGLVKLRGSAVVKLAILFSGSQVDHCRGPDAMKVIKRVPLRGIADTTKRVSAPAPVVQITGQSVVWWFNGQNPSGYTTTVTLTALPSGGSSYSWQFTAGSSKASFSNQSGNTINVKGTALSTGLNDISVKVTVTTSAGTGPSGPFNMTVKGPYKLVPGSNFYSADPNYGYDTKLYYTIKDNLGANLPLDVGFAEQWTAPMDNSPYPSNNWGSPLAVGSTSSNSEFYDHFTGPGLANTPPAGADADGAWPDSEQCPCPTARSGVDRGQHDPRVRSSGADRHLAEVY